MKFVLLFVFVSVFASEYATADDFKCEKGVPYIENACNTCACTDNGKLVCTLKACSGTEKYYNCKVGTTSQTDCNTCWCVKDMGTICTNKQC